MGRHKEYLKYVLRHKWFVLVASWKIGASIWRALIHDLSKFTPKEWFPYAEAFYAPDGKKHYNPNEMFDYAWNHHQKQNKHHWQYWLLTQDEEEPKTLAMPRKYILEMVADWMGAGKAITGEWEILEWYEKHKDNIIIHEETRKHVHALLYDPVLNEMLLCERPLRSI